MVDFRNFYKDKANIAYMLLGYPTLALSEEFLKNLDKTKIDIVELGVAYSDPIADGKVISDAAFKARQQGVDIHKVFKSLSKIKTKKPLAFLVYYNMIFAYGLESFVKASKKAGIKALIVPDLPYEENEALYKECLKEDIALVALISVTTPKERIEKILSRANGFIYLVASLGITGGKQVIKSRLKQKVQEIKEFTNLPVFIGFGIKNASNVASIKQICDGAIVGTSVIEAFKESKLDKIIHKVNEIFG